MAAWLPQDTVVPLRSPAVRQHRIGLRNSHLWDETCGRKGPNHLTWTLLLLSYWICFEMGECFQKEFAHCPICEVKTPQIRCALVHQAKKSMLSYGRSPCRSPSSIGGHTR